MTAEEKKIYEEDLPLESTTPLLNILTLGGFGKSILQNILAKKGATKLSRGETLIPKDALKWKGFSGLNYTPLKDAAVRAGNESSKAALKLSDEYNPAVLKSIWTKDTSKFISPHPNIKVMPKGTNEPIDILGSLKNYKGLGIKTTELPKYISNIYPKGTFKTIWK